MDDELIIEHSADCGALYRQKRHELLDFVRTLTDPELHAVVAATPEWTVHDVVAHLVGITVDLNAGNFGDGDPDAWTARQVDARRSLSIAELEQEWEREAHAFEHGLRLLGYEIGSHYVGDLLQHSQDIREALGAPPIADDAALAVALDFYLDHFHQTLTAAGIGTVAVHVGDDCVNVGSGPPVATVAASRFGLLRALGGRRNERGIRALDWTGDVDVILPFVAAYPLTTREGDTR